jgi:hypothetical protein
LELEKTNMPYINLADQGLVVLFEFQAAESDKQDWRWEKIVVASFN